jgi:signal transduction histidine kinase
MTRNLSERSRLPATTARSIGLATTIAALVCVLLPGALPFPLPTVGVAVLLVIIGVCYLRLPRSRTVALPFAIAVLGIAVVVVIGCVGASANDATLSALPVIAGGSVAAVTVAVGIGPRTLPALTACLAAALAALVVTLALIDGPVLRPIALTLTGWAVCCILALWLGRIVPQTIRRITSMGRAFRAERQASETEARRRQGARLLHDTVLATLTLLAHSGVGVSEPALREQAAEDAALLRQLRMGFTPNPSASGDYNLKPVQESTLGNTLESVKQRFRRIGLEVNWHGTGHVLLPSETLDAFLLALAECLENVRRHSGVDQAHVTITDDEATVRAMVTDDGVGFELDAVGEGRLGFAESIVARLRDVGGNARLFSSPGSGTTVVLEVPK